LVDSAEYDTEWVRRRAVNDDVGTPRLLGRSLLTAGVVVAAAVLVVVALAWSSFGFDWAPGREARSLGRGHRCGGVFRCRPLPCASSGPEQLIASWRAHPDGSVSQVTGSPRDDNTA
jgi:hypothetical protein